MICEPSQRVGYFGVFDASFLKGERIHIDDICSLFPTRVRIENTAVAHMLMEAIGQNRLLIGLPPGAMTIHSHKQGLCHRFRELGIIFPPQRSLGALYESSRVTNVVKRSDTKNWLTGLHSAVVCFRDCCCLLSSVQFGPVASGDWKSAHDLLRAINLACD